MDVKFTMVMEEELARSRTTEFEWACKVWVQEFEKNVDKI